MQVAAGSFAPAAEDRSLAARTRRWPQRDLPRAPL